MSDITLETFEDIAEWLHNLWMLWANEIIRTEPHLSKDRKERWRGYLIPYNKLPESAKEHDREKARDLLRHLILVDIEKETGTR